MVNSVNNAKKQLQSFSNNNLTSTFVAEHGVGDFNGPKRISISEDVKERM